ncbi:MAG TPA: iron ABC transporter permease, partial [Cyanothece sp. UBA12306]|nr:iron ABC transporter permease [Cyanothece sp. UBA12306]
MITNSQSIFLKTKSLMNRIPFNSWTILVIIIATLIATPILFVFGSIFADSGEVWQHLLATVLQDYLTNSFLLMVGVGVGVLIIGIGTAWLVTMCRFRGSRYFEWLLLLPLSAPAYLLAYTYTNMLDYYGPVQVSLRHWFGWNSVGDYWFPNIRSLWGAIAMLILVLYPYVYLLARTAFLEQSVCTLEASRSLGCTPWQSFYQIALPLARPAIMAGLALVLMETLNDFGTVQYFGVNTFTTGIYSTWFGLGERVAATQLAAFLMLFILGLIGLELWSRRQARYYQTSSNQLSLTRYSLESWRCLLAFLACFFPFALGFLVPALYLLELVLLNIAEALNNNFWQLASHSFILSVLTAIAAVILALIMAYGQRLQSNLIMGLGVR